LIHGHFVGRVAFVVIVDFVNIVFEGIESEEEFISIITFLILLNPFSEAGFVFFFFKNMIVP